MVNYKHLQSFPLRSLLTIVFIILYLALLIWAITSNSVTALIIIALVIPAASVLIWLSVLLINRARGIPGSRFNLKLTAIFSLISIITPIGLAIYGGTMIRRSLGVEIDTVSQNVDEIITSMQKREENYSIDTKTKEFISLLKGSQPYTTPLTIPDDLVKKIPRELDVFMIFEYKSEDEELPLIIQSLFDRELFINPESKETQFNVDEAFMIDIVQSVNFAGEEINNLAYWVNDSIILLLSIVSVVERENLYGLGGHFITGPDVRIITNAQEIVNKIGNTEYYIDTIISKFRLFVLFVSLPMILLALLLGFFIARQVTKPLSALVRGTEIVASGNLNYTIKERGSDEIGQLIHSFNNMTEELNRNKNKLYQAEKIAAWREVARRLAHEVKNPLTPIKLAAERILRKWERPNDVKPFEEVLFPCVSTIISEADRLRDMVNEFSEFARLPGPSMEKENVLKVLSETVEFYKETHQKIKFLLENHLTQQELIIFFDKKQIKQVIINLIENAIDACNNTGTITLTLKSNYRLRNLFLRIEIKDSGPGIPPDIMDQLFLPYFSTKEKGTGLGLPIVKSIVEAHGGYIYYENAKDKGAIFIIEIPYQRGEDEKYISG